MNVFPHFHSISPKSRPRPVKPRTWDIGSPQKTRHPPTFGRGKTSEIARLATSDPMGRTINVPFELYLQFCHLQVFPRDQKGAPNMEDGHTGPSDDEHSQKRGNCKWTRRAEGKAVCGFAGRCSLFQCAEGETKGRGPRNIAIPGGPKVPPLILGKREGSGHRRILTGECGPVSRAFANGLFGLKQQKAGARARR